MAMVFAVAPHHPLAAASEPLDDAELVRHRAVAVADSAQRLTPITVNLLAGQDVLTVSEHAAPRSMPMLRCTRLRLRAGADGAATTSPPAAWWSRRCSATGSRAASATPGARRCGAHAARQEAAARPRAALVAGAARERDDAQGPARAPRQPGRRPDPVTPYVGRFAPSPTGPAARRLAGGGAGVVARCPGRTAGAGWCASKTSTGRATSPAPPRPSSQQLARLRPGGPTRRRCGNRRAAASVRAGARPPASRDGWAYRLRLQPARHRARARGARGRRRARHAELVYPAPAAAACNGKTARSFRLRTDLAPEGGVVRPSPGATAGSDARTEDVAASVGDFVLQPRRRRSGRTSSRSSSTMRAQGHHRRRPRRRPRPATPRGRSCCSALLGLPTPRYLHTPLVLAANGEKLSKQTGAQALDLARPLDA